MIFETLFSYRHCEKCEKYIDDGSYKNGKYLCHDCLDNEE